jgi:hypothetical protein
MNTKSSCWAAMLGDCQGGISQEHYISRSMWDTEVVNVVGFPWCKEEPKQIPVARLTAGVLCVHHNQTLSEVDAAGASIFRTFRLADELCIERSTRPHFRWPQSSFNINGWALERWLAKAMMGILRAGYKLTSDQEDESTLHALVRCAFNLSRLEAPRGLYVPVAVGDDVPVVEGFRFAPVYSRDEKIIGGIFFFRGYRMILNVSNLSPLRGAEVPLSYFSSELVQRSSLYRPEQIKFNIGRRTSHRIRFRW